jgi:uncharacterized protein with PQ loop repeat
MEYFTPTEIVGYLASLIVLLSFLMKDLKTLRMVNILGCLVFTTYGILLGFSIPIIVTNLTIVVINVVYLIKLKREIK